jgi:hypothetical protein
VDREGVVVTEGMPVAKLAKSCWMRISTEIYVFQLLCQTR